MVGDHYIVSDEWRPNFEPEYAEVNNLRVWVRLPNLPIEFATLLAIESIEQSALTILP
ncbi:hypothetical protein LINPERHAP1_LOCUS21463 [Linum perenne]